MNKKRGISLVLLIVTIIVMLILSSAVILNISSADGQISAAQRANIVNDISVFKDELNIKLSNDPRINLEEFPSNDISESMEDILLKYIPSIYEATTPSGIKYVDVLAIQKGKIVLKDSKNLLEQEEKNAILELVDEFSK